MATKEHKERTETEPVFAIFVLSVAGVCLNPRLAGIVILSGAQDPAGDSQRGPGLAPPAGFFASLRMTNQRNLVLRTRPNAARGPAETAPTTAETQNPPRAARGPARTS